LAEGSGMTTKQMRERLREAMADCPGCSPFDVESIPEEDLWEWLMNHGVNPDTGNALPVRDISDDESPCT
jgi:hypothetical protein